MASGFDMEDPYYLGVEDLHINSLNLWAHIRPIDWDFVESLSEQMRFGWTCTSMICVVELAVVQGKQTYGVVDGAHRITTAKQLIQKGILSEKTKVTSRIYKGSTPAPHLLALAFFANEGQEKNTVLVTMFHRLWWVYSMAKVVVQESASVQHLTYFSIANHAGTPFSFVPFA